MDVKLTDLPWLPEPPADFRQRVRTLSASKAEPREFAQSLTQYRLNNSQLHSLGAAIRTAIAGAASVDKYRLGILSSATGS